MQRGAAALLRVCPSCNVIPADGAHPTGGIGLPSHPVVFYNILSLNEAPKRVVFGLKISVYSFQWGADISFFKGDMPLRRCMERLRFKHTREHSECRVSWKGALIRRNGPSTSSTLKCRRRAQATRKCNSPRWVNKDSQGNRNRWGFLQFQNGAALHTTDKGSPAKMWNLMETELGLLGVGHLSKTAKAPGGHSDLQHVPFRYHYRHHHGQCLGRAFTCLE